MKKQSSITDTQKLMNIMIEMQKDDETLPEEPASTKKPSLKKEPQVEMDVTMA